VAVQHQTLSLLSVVEPGEHVVVLMNPFVVRTDGSITAETNKDPVAFCAQSELIYFHFVFNVVLQYLDVLIVCVLYTILEVLIDG
jgi:hypothetical protein